MSMRFTILGCGSSGGVPRVGNVWGNCDPANPKNRRRRCALLVERFGKQGRTTVLVDTPPDLREQLLAARVEHIDGVLFTHDHADHTHGIDDLRGMFFITKRRIPIYADADTRASLESRFDYCFAQKPGSIYPVDPRRPTISVRPSPCASTAPAGRSRPCRSCRSTATSPSLGFRFGDLAYSPDISGIPEASVALLQGLDVWIVDALRPAPHPSHFGVKQTLQWIERLGVKRAILTHMTVELDYDALRRELPAHVEPAYDGMVVET